MPFCAYCGTQLKEGENCTCVEARANANQQAAAAPEPSIKEPVYQAPPSQTPTDFQQAPPPAAPQFQQAPPQQQTATYQMPPQQAASYQMPPQAAKLGHKLADSGKSLLPFLQSYFRDPRQAVEAVVQQNNLSLAVCLTVIRLLATGLAVYGLLRKTCSMALNVLMQAAIYGSSADMLTADLSASFITSVLYGALIGAVGMALFFVLALLLSKLSHSGLSACAVFEACAANGLFTTLLLILAFVASFLSIPAFLVCMMLALLAWLVTGVLTAQIVCADRCSGLFWLVYLIGAVLIIFIGYKLYPQLFLRAIGGIKASYMGRTITLKNAIDALLSIIRSELGDFESFSDELDDILTSLWWNIY